MRKKKGIKPVDIAIQLIKEGYSKDFVIQNLIENSIDIITPDQAKGIFSEAESFVKNEYDRKVTDIWNLHSTRYRKQISRLLATEELEERNIAISCTYEEWQASRQKKIKAYDQALTTMKQLENLCLIHHESILEINDDTQINIDETKQKINLTKLTFDEQLELLQLMQKARIDNNELKSVSEAILSSVLEDENILQLIPEEPNVGQIKQEEIEPQPNAPAFNSNPTKKLIENLKRIAAQKFRDAGGKLNETEEGLLNRLN